MNPNLNFRNTATHCRGRRPPVIFPSYLGAEAFGVTLLEDAMCSKPLISAEVGAGSSHVNLDHETGLSVTPASAYALREAMDELHHDPQRCAELGWGARQRYQALFTGKLGEQRYTKLYQELMRA